MAGRSTQKNKKNTNTHKQGAGCIIWLILIAFVFIIYFVNQENIARVLKNTNFKSIVDANKTNPTTEPVIINPDTKEIKPNTKPNTDTITIKTDPSSDKTDPAINPSAEETKPATEDTITTTEKTPSGTEKDTKTTTTDKTKTDTTKTTTSTVKTTNQTEEASKVRKANLYFVRVDDDGTISRTLVQRTIKENDSPLKDSLTALLSGPTADELKRGLITLIPTTTKLLSVSIRGSTAVLSFSEGFMFNSLGIEGYMGQLKQVVYTVTEFTTIHDVQILIDGAKVNYLGGEGVYIGSPLSRNSF